MSRAGIHWIVMFCALLAPGAIALAQPKPVPLPGDQTFVHQPSGFEFPVTVAQFKRDTAVQFDEAGKDFSVCYRNGDPGATADVYVYPRGGRELKEEFAEVRDTLRRIPQYSNVKVVNESTYTLKQGDRSFAGMRGTFEYTITDGDERREVRSTAYVFVLGDNFVKFRITYLKEAAEAVEKLIEPFIVAMKFPNAK
jgi:hypothetical protein